MSRRSSRFFRRLASWLLLAVTVLGTLAFHPAEERLRASAPAAVPRLTPTPQDTHRSILAPESRVVARVFYFSLADRDRLAAEYDAVETATTGGYVTVLLTDPEHAALLAAGYRVEIDQVHTDLVNSPAPSGGTAVEGIPGYTCYRTVEETYADMAALAAAHPTLAAWNDIGDSWEKVTSGGSMGYDLKVLVLTNQARPGPKPVFFLIAAIHAREYTTAELAVRYAEYLLSNYGVDPDVTWLLDHVEIHILPQANPDGRKRAETGLYHRKNTNDTNGGSCGTSGYNHFGTDLNRNSTFHWGGIGSGTDPCGETYRGPTAHSEPETQAIEAYALAHLADQRGPLITDAAPAETEGVFITLHSYGNQVLFPWGDTSDPAPNASGFLTLGRKFGFFNGYQVCQPTLCLYSTSGTTDDFVYGELGAAAYTFELGTWFFQDCATFDNNIMPGNLPALLYAAKAARRPYQSPAGPDSVQVSVSASMVMAGAPLTLTVLADDTRYDSGGYGIEATQTISAMRYSVNAPAWVGGTATYPLAAADGAFDETSESAVAGIETTGWALGKHLLFVESQDVDGNWGVPGAAFVCIEGPETVLAAPQESASSGAAGEMAAHFVELTSLVAVPGTFTATVTGNAWAVEAPTLIGPLGKCDVAPLLIRVSIPPGTLFGAEDAANLTFTSSVEPSLTATIHLRTVANLVRLYLPVVGHP